MTTTHPERLPLLTRRDRIMITITAIASMAAGVLYFAHANALLAFTISALALATLASLVGRSVEAVGTGSGPTPLGYCRRRWETCPSCSSSYSHSRQAFTAW